MTEWIEWYSDDSGSLQKQKMTEVVGNVCRLQSTRTHVACEFHPDPTVAHKNLPVTKLVQLSLAKRMSHIGWDSKFCKVRGLCAGDGRLRCRRKGICQVGLHQVQARSNCKRATLDFDNTGSICGHKLTNTPKKNEWPQPWMPHKRALHAHLVKVKKRQGGCGG